MKRTLMALVAALGVSAVQANAVSGFNTDAEGWTGVTVRTPENGAPVELSNLALTYTSAPGNPAGSPGGHPGGAVGLLDPDSWDFYFAAAGSAYLGAHSSAYGASLGYDLLTTVPVGVSYSPYNGPNIILKGNGITLVHQTSSQVAVNGQWISFLVTLDPSDGQWHLDRSDGAAAQASDFQAVLSNITDFWIAGETHNGVQETSWLDNVFVTEIPGTNVPEPGSLLLAAGAIAALAGRRRVR